MCPGQRGFAYGEWEAYACFVSFVGGVLRILILHASAGSGHRRAAEALVQAFRTHHPEVEVVVRDVLDFTPAVFRRTYAKGYLRLVRKAPELWGYLYTRTDRTSQIPWRKRVRSVLNAVNTGSLFKYMDALEPDAVVCTHFMALEVVSTHQRRRVEETPFFCCVTDFDVHSLWIAENVRCYYVATEEAQRSLIRMGQPPDQIEVSGIPVSPEFAVSVPAPEMRRRLGLDPGRMTVLLLSGGFGVGPSLELIRAIDRSGLNCQLLAVTGNNRKLRSQVEHAAQESSVPVRVFGYVSNVHELMDAADIVLGKSGGLTCSEAMAKGKPMLIIDPIPGQEQRNCEYLLEAGAAARLFEIEDAPDKIRAILEDAERIAQLQSNARLCGRPNAAADIADSVLQRCIATPVSGGGVV
jgi:processive 1,2-diacylglycerol beta-glucosyltransferase